MRFCKLVRLADIDQQDRIGGQAVPDILQCQVLDRGRNRVRHRALSSSNIRPSFINPLKPHQSEPHRPPETSSVRRSRTNPPKSHLNGRLGCNFELGKPPCMRVLHSPVPIPSIRNDTGCRSWRGSEGCGSGGCGVGGRGSRGRGLRRRRGCNWDGFNWSAQEGAAREGAAWEDAALEYAAQEDAA